MSKAMVERCLLTEDDLRAFVGKCIVFGPKVIELEDYAEPGMHARVTGFEFDGARSDPNDIVHTIYVDFSQFDVSNRRFESADYNMGSRGMGRGTARESGWYKVKDRVLLASYADQLPFSIDEVATEQADARLEAESPTRDATLRECAEIAARNGIPGLGEQFLSMLSDYVPAAVDPRDVG